MVTGLEIQESLSIDQNCAATTRDRQENPDFSSFITQMLANSTLFFVPSLLQRQRYKSTLSEERDVHSAVTENFWGQIKQAYNFCYLQMATNSGHVFDQIQST